MKRGLILEGGAIKGSYQIGAYYAFKKLGIKFDGFGGTSIGSFNAALLACNKGKELLHFWQTVDPGVIIGADEKLIKAINSENLELPNLLKGAIGSVKKWIGAHGIDTKPLYDVMENLLVEDELRKSKKDFGLVTVKLKGFKPKYIYKEDIPEGKLYDYILASCYLPVFKMNKIIDDNIYLDGGFYDNCPVSLLLDKGYDIVYAVKINGIGLSKKLQKKQDEKVIYITPSRNICKTFEMNREIINENILMGFYDTLRTIGNYDGIKYVFKKRSNKYYEHLVRKVDSKTYKYVASYFKTNDPKIMVIKAVEYMAEKKYIDYYNIYRLYNLVLKIRKNGYKKNKIYDFVKQLRLF